MKTISLAEIHFPGFSKEAFEILDRLKENPWAEQYQKEKPAIQKEIMEPFKLLRDDLVVHWLIPGDYDLVTEKNVFSRFLKNDFGRGGSNHHIWFSFYRHGFKRLTDLQLAYSLFPDGLNIGLYVAERARESMARVRSLMTYQEDSFVKEINSILELENYFAVLKRKDAELIIDSPIVSIDENWTSAKEIWIKTFVPREVIVSSRTKLFAWILETTSILDPLYRYWIDQSHEANYVPNSQ